MSAFDKGKQWKAAKALLIAMEKSFLNSTKVDDTEWVLPSPNEFTYASAISSCARCSQFEEALEILDRMRNNAQNSTIEDSPSPNRWVYNSALAACVPPSQNWLGNYTERFHTAVEIIRRMEEDALLGHDTAPDTISYNSALAAVTGLAREVSKRQSTVMNDDDIDTIVQLDETMIEQLLDEMSEKGLKKDHVTYRNAIVACRSNPEAALRLLDRAMSDKCVTNVPRTVAESDGEIREYLINAAISVCASNGRMDLITKLFAYFQQFQLLADSRTMVYLVKGLSRSEHYEDAMILLNAMKGDGVANAQFLEKHNINVRASANITSEAPMIQEGHYSAAIAGSLRRGKLFQALKILNAMKLHGLTPNDSSLRGIILAYCKLATDEATHEYRLARREYASKTSQTRGPLFKANTDMSRSRAEAALAMMQGLKVVPVRLQCVVASACAATGMWDEAKELLWKIHIAAVIEKRHEATAEAINVDQGSALAELPKLHRSLLKLCARSGNIRAALWYTDAIQDLKLKLEGKKYRERINDSDESLEVMQNWDTATASFQYGIGMSGEDWKLLMIAASKSAHWKVCLGTLPFIQPFVEATHPRHASTSVDSKTPLRTLNREYEKLSRALTAAILAFEIRSQYAWAVRAIDDWTEWSGRRPPKEALFSACRVLSSRGQGGQVTALVNRVLRIKPHSKVPKKNISYETSYEMAVYVEAITALVNNGLYDSADELYLEALSRGFLPFTIIEKTSNKQLKLDLHGMTRATAHSAVRVALQHLVQSSNGEGLNQDILIVTGKGKRSEKHLRPVLRPEVQRMLMEEFYPPISTFSVPKNTGALIVSSGDVNAWLEYQKQQRGVRFLAVADILKNITMGTRLRKILAENLKGKE
jgi:pentatricopeptide repeat protein